MCDQNRYRGAWRASLMLSAVLLATTACQDLNVVNEVDPDRARILGSAEELEVLVGGSVLPNLYAPLSGWTGTGFALAGLITSLWPLQAAEFSASMAGNLSAQWHLDLLEPRQPHQNAPVIAGTIGPWGPRTYWAMMGVATASPYDGLFLMDGGVQVIGSDGVDRTPRLRAFSKLAQGWAWGYQALIFDRVNVVPETIDFASMTFEELQALPLSSLKDYDEAMEDALAAIDEAIQLAQQFPDIVHFPADGSPAWFGTPEPVSNTQFIQLANTLAARMLILNARSPQDRANVDWNRVLAYTANGLQQGNDIEVVLSAVRPSTIYQRAQWNAATGVGATPGAYRWDYRAIGPSDQSGGFQTWINNAPQDRVKFEIDTPDRRITGPGGPTTNGSYTRYRPDDIGFIPARGSYFLGHYQWSRHAIRNDLTGNTSPGHQEGTHLLISADENALYRAEALYRTGGPSQEVANLINITRTRDQKLDGGQVVPNLPPVTAAGVPEIGGVCVPRTDAGACGTLATAIRYERMIETAGMDGVRGYADSRGFGLLPDGTPRHYPIPGNVLEQYELPNYTYGGVGTEWGAVYDPWN